MLLLHPKHISFAPNEQNADQPVQPATCTILSVLYISTFSCGLFFAILSVLGVCVSTQETLQNLQKIKRSVDKKQLSY